MYANGISMYSDSLDVLLAEYSDLVTCTVEGIQRYESRTLWLYLATHLHFKSRTIQLMHYVLQ